MYFKNYINLPERIGTAGLKLIQRINGFRSFFFSYKTVEGDKALSTAQVNDFNKHRFVGPRKAVCYAPFNNIYFGSNGNAIACCYNRDHLFGTYPKLNLTEIWGNDANLRLRKKMLENDLSSGCKLCYNQLVNGNYDALSPYYYDLIPVQRNYPSSMEFELSNTCNLACIMCTDEFSSQHEESSSRRMVYDIAFTEQLEEFIPHLKQTRFFGGEPFLIGLYYTIWEKIIALNPKCRITVQTNATVLNSKVKEILERGNFHIGISIDSLQKENYETIRRNAKFESVMDNIEYFVEYCKRKSSTLSISICPMTINWQEIPDIINFCNQRRAWIYFNTVIYPPELSIQQLGSSEIDNIIIKLSGCSLETGNIFSNKNKKHFIDFIMLLRGWKDDAEKAEEQRKQKIEDYNAELNTVSGLNLNALVEKLKNTVRRVVKQSKILTDEETERLILSIAESIEENNNVEKLPYLKLAIHRIMLNENVLEEKLKKKRVEEIVHLFRKYILQMISEYPTDTKELPNERQ